MTDISNIQRFTNNILENSLHLKDECNDLNRYVQNLVTALKNRTPQQKRDKYNIMITTLDDKITDSNSAITNLVTTQNEINKNFTETINCYKELRELLEKSKLIYNKAQVGTLQGLAGNIVSKYNITATDNISAAIKEQPYKEPNGGRRKKSRKQKRNKSHKRK